MSINIVNIVHHRQSH